MKKYLYLALVVMFVVVTAGVCYGDGGGALYAHGPDDEIEMEVLVSTAAGSCIEASSISTSNRILGYTFLSTTAGSMGLYDATTANTKAGTGVIVEDSVIANSANTVWFPFPKKVDTSIRAIFSASDARLTIYYE